MSGLKKKSKKSQKFSSGFAGRKRGLEVNLARFGQQEGGLARSNFLGFTESAVCIAGGSSKDHRFKAAP